MGPVRLGRGSFHGVGLGVDASVLRQSYVPRRTASIRQRDLNDLKEAGLFLPPVEKIYIELPEPDNQDHLPDVTRLVSSPDNRVLNDLASVGDTDAAFLVQDRAELVSALSQILNEQNPGATSRTAPVQTGLTPGLVQAEFISGFNVSSDADDPWDGILERRRIE